LKDEEKVLNKLKYGAIFACPRCGGRKFVVKSYPAVYDLLEVNEDGTATVWQSDLKEVDTSLEDAAVIYCDNCELKVSKRKLIALLGDRIEYKPKGWDE
jgi:transcription elongation factor Elf1